LFLTKSQISVPAAAVPASLRQLDLNSATAQGDHPHPGGEKVAVTSTLPVFEGPVRH